MTSRKTASDRKKNPSNPALHHISKYCWLTLNKVNYNDADMYTRIVTAKDNKAHIPTLQCCSPTQGSSELDPIMCPLIWGKPSKKRICDMQIYMKRIFGASLIFPLHRMEGRQKTYVQSVPGISLMVFPFTSSSTNIRGFVLQSS